MKIIILGVIFPDTLLLGESDEVLAKGTYRHSKMIDCDLVYIKDKEYDSAGYAQITISRHLIDFTSRSLVTFLLSLITLARLFYLSRIG